MTDVIKDDLLILITKIRAKNPSAFTKTNDVVMKYITKFLIDEDIEDDIVKYALKYYEDEDIYNKPLPYFLKILTNQRDERIKAKEKEQRSLGGIP